MWKIPLFDPDIGPEEMAAVNRPLADRWLPQGRRTEEFESAFAEALGAPYAIAVTSGTAALHLAMVVAGAGPAHEVIVPSLTFVATANVVRYQGAIPVFADIVGEGDLTISPDSIASKITSHTAGIIPVHYAGFSCRMQEILALAERHGLFVVEDAAHAIFTKEGTQYCGTYGLCGCFSFYSNKNMTTAEGGMIVTSDPKIAERVRRLRTHSMTTGTTERFRGSALSYDVTELGWNYRLDDLRGSLGLAQLRRLPARLQRRNDLRSLYVGHLSKLTKVTIPFRDRTGEIGYHIMPILLDPGIDRENVMRQMSRRGIQTSIHYPPIHAFTAYRDRSSARLPLTEDVAARLITLPFYPSMSDEMVEEVVNSLGEILT